MATNNAKMEDSLVNNVSNQPENVASWDRNMALVISYIPYDQYLTLLRERVDSKFLFRSTVIKL